MLNGELSIPELALLRTHPQRTDLYLAIPTYSVVYTARVDGTPASTDGIFEIDFYGGTGTLTDVDAGMTLLVGSAAGLSDIGIARIRENAGLGDTSFQIGTTSDIDFADNQYLTITNEFGLWPRHPYVDPATGDEYMDQDIAYTNQHRYYDPVPVMGPHAVAELTGASVAIAWDASGSYSCSDEASALLYAWTCAGATVTTPAASTTSIVFSSAGTYLVRLVLTADYGGGITKTTTAYRYVVVHDSDHPLIRAAILDSCEGDYSAGGWSYRVTLHSECDSATIRKRVLCLLVAKDWYGATPQSIGPLLGRENIVCVGWIDGESITRSNDTGDVSFDVHGPTFWLDKMQGYPTGVDDSIAVPTTWTTIQALNTRKGLWHFLHWRTTATSVLDIPLIVPAWEVAAPRRLATTYTPAGSLSEQLRAIADRIFMKAVADRYGRIFCDVDPNLTEVTDRTFPDVFTNGPELVEQDWRDEITIERRIVSECALADVSGIYWSGVVATSSALFAISPGHYYKHYGSPQKRDRLSFLNQAQCNDMAGLYAGWLNNEFPNVDIPFASNLRALDIAPSMWLTMSLASDDTPREIEWTAKRFTPRRISFERDAGEGVLLTAGTFEAETTAETAMIGDPPLVPPNPPPPPDPPDPPDPPLPSEGDVVIVMTPTQIGRSLNFFEAVPTWEDMSAGLSGEYYHICVNDVGEAWCVTLDGFYYCADVAGVAPTWTLRMALATVRALDASFATANFGGCYCGPDGAGWTVLADVKMPGTNAIVFVKDNVITYVIPVGAILGLWCTGHQYCLGATATTLRASLTSGAATTFAYMDVPTGIGSFAGVSGARICFLISSLGTYAVNEGYNMATIPDMDITTKTEVEHDLPVIELGADLLWAKHGLTPPGTTGDLMINAIVQAIPADVGAVSGVFGSAVSGAFGAAFVFVDTSAHIIWVAGSAAANNTYRSIGYTEDGGFVWQTKDGNWAAAMGAAYEGKGGGSLPCVVRYNW